MTHAPAAAAKNTKSAVVDQNKLTVVKFIKI
jgi:hypothetical protein